MIALLTRAAAEILEVVPISAAISYGSVAIGLLSASEVQVDAVSAAVTEARRVSALVEGPGCVLGRSSRDAVWPRGGEATAGLTSSERGLRTHDTEMDGAIDFLKRYFDRNA